MWGRYSTDIYNNTAPGMATLARVIVDCTMKMRSRIEPGSQIATMIEEELQNAV